MPSLYLTRRSVSNCGQKVSSFGVNDRRPDITGAWLGYRWRRTIGICPLPTLSSLRLQLQESTIGYVFNNSTGNVRKDTVIEKFQRSTTKSTSTIVSTNSRLSTSRRQPYWRWRINLLKCRTGIVLPIRLLYLGPHGPKYKRRIGKPECRPKQVGLSSLRWDFFLRTRPLALQQVDVTGHHSQQQQQQQHPSHPIIITGCSQLNVIRCLAHFGLFHRISFCPCYLYALLMCYLAQ